MWIDRLLDTRTSQAIELAARFAEERHTVLAENIANIDTPGYRTRQLDARLFQKALREALQRTDSRNGDPLILRGDGQVSTDAAGRLTIRPQLEPADNLLFHDGTNARLEQLVADVAENQLYYNLSTNLLSQRFDSLSDAIRGRVQ
jgi:flagellar basal-body rod protein FlgB